MVQIVTGKGGKIQLVERLFALSMATFLSGLSGKNAQSHVAEAFKTGQGNVTTQLPSTMEQIVREK